MGIRRAGILIVLGTLCFAHVLGGEVLARPETRDGNAIPTQLDRHQLASYGGSPAYDSGWQTLGPRPDPIPVLFTHNLGGDEDTYLVGHSMGCQCILRYLDDLPEGTKIGGAIFVAGFVNLKNLETPEEKKLAKPWLETPIDWDKIVSHTKKFFALFSDNDPWVPVSDADIFKDKLGAKTLVVHDKGHINEESDVLELPVVLEELLKMSE